MSTKSNGAPSNPELVIMAEKIAPLLATALEKYNAPSGWKEVKAAAAAKVKARKEEAKARKEAKKEAKKNGVTLDAEETRPETYDKYTEWDARNMCFCLGCAAAVCKFVPVCGSKIASGISSGFKCHVRAPALPACPCKCSCTLPKLNCKIPCLCCLKCTTVGCEFPFGCCLKQCNCCHVTCGCFPILLYPVIKLACCANFEKIDENQNVGAPLTEAIVQKVDLGVPQSAVMERGGSEE